MTELVERYVHQVGRYLPQKERAEIEAELRSQIQDQLDDRYGGSPTQAEVASLLAELGHPYRMATSYSSEQYLIGPGLYPYLMFVLRRGWLIVPSIVIFLNVFEALTSSQTITALNVVVDTVFAALQATLIFSAVVILIFAVIQRLANEHAEFEQEFDEAQGPFDPLELPKVDDPTSVDRFESVFGVAFGLFATLAFLYFLQVGGLTLRFNLTDPGDVIPVSTLWLTLLIVVTVAMTLVQLWVLRRNRWGVMTWLAQTILEVIGVFCLYFVIYTPIFERMIVTVPDLTDVPLPEIIAVITAVTNLMTRGAKLVRLWGYRNNPALPFTIHTNA